MRCYADQSPDSNPTRCFSALRNAITNKLYKNTNFVSLREGFGSPGSSWADDLYPCGSGERSRGPSSRPDRSGQAGSLPDSNTSFSRSHWSNFVRLLVCGRDSARPDRHGPDDLNPCGSGERSRGPSSRPDRPGQAGSLPDSNTSFSGSNWRAHCGLLSCGRDSARPDRHEPDDLNLVYLGRGHGIHRLAPFDPGKRDPSVFVRLSRVAQRHASERLVVFAEGIRLARIGKGPTT